MESWFALKKESIIICLQKLEAERGSLLFPIGPFTISEEIGEFYVVQERRATDSKAQKLWKGQSGCTQPCMLFAATHSTGTELIWLIPCGSRGKMRALRAVERGFESQQCSIGPGPPNWSSSSRKQGSRTKLIARNCAASVISRNMKLRTADGHTYNTPDLSFHKFRAPRSGDRLFLICSGTSMFMLQNSKTVNKSVGVVFFFYSK